MEANMAKQRRLDAIDFWRGVILCMIFINHVPGNVFEHFTSRNFGFSDASEAFVFISGVSVALAYGRHFRNAASWSGPWRLLNRAGVLYGAQVASSFAALGVFAAGWWLLGDPSLLATHGRALFVTDPLQATLAVLSLGHQLGYFNILPLYIVLMLLAGALLLLARWDVRVMLCASVALYAVARLGPLSLPTWPDEGAWFFNPFAWQLLFAMGVAVGWSLQDAPKSDVTGSGFTDVVALAVVMASAVVVSDAFGLVPGLASASWPRLDIAKDQLGLVRLLHFMALAYVVCRLRLHTYVRGSAVYAGFSLLGRQSLTVFVAGSLLAAVGQVIYVARPASSLLLDCAVVGAGLATQLAIAWVAEARGLSTGWLQRTAPAPASLR
jgi:hypothetical protein